mmetsp:Transcript_6830/g.12189  ORF Transcript_6830/g.12189 Transcript_6830/m.12189 type:complete len:100 (-) Transcript_6830:205-504(-)
MVRNIIELGFKHPYAGGHGQFGRIQRGGQQGYQQPSYPSSYKCLNNNMVDNTSSINSNNFMSPSGANNMDYSQVFLLFLQFNHLLGVQPRRCSRWANLL